MRDFPGFDFIVVREIGLSGVIAIFSDIDEAFLRLGFWGPRFVRVSDEGDRVLLKPGHRLGPGYGSRSISFSLNGCVSLQGWEVLAAYRRKVLSNPKPPASPSPGFRCLPVKARRWHRRDECALPRFYAEMRDGLGLAFDEETASLGIGVRGKRLAPRAERHRRSRQGGCWKNFRRTRWKED